MVVAISLLISGLLGLTAVVLMLTRSWAFVVVAICVSFSAATAPFILRRTGSVAKAATPLLVVCALGINLPSFTKNATFLSTSSYAVLYAFMSFYLIGVRYGAVYFTMMVGLATMSFIVYATGHQVDVQFTQPRDDPAYVACMVVALGVMGGLVYHYETVRQRALGELGTALTVVERNQRQLSGLVENTDSCICSLDLESRLQVFNHRFRELATQQRGVAPSVGDALEQCVDAEQLARWRPAIEVVLGQATCHSIEETDNCGGDQDARRPEQRSRETYFYPILQDEKAVGVVVVSQDITERKRNEAEMKRLYAELVELSRQAGMAVVASEVLQTAGSILNSVNVSASLMEDRLRSLKLSRFCELVTLVEAHGDDLEAFFRGAKGRSVADVLCRFAEHFADQEQGMSQEIAGLREGIAHLTQVVQVQQSHARGSDAIEEVTLDELIDSVLALDGPLWKAMEVDIQRDISGLPTLRIAKQKVLEILMHLITNARQALRDSQRPDKRLCIRAEPSGDEGVVIHIEDNGVGIAARDLDKIFQLGFTTKEYEHGFGLHSSLIAATQLRGRLVGRSDGLGKGAIFSLELPLQPLADMDRGGDAADISVAEATVAAPPSVSG